VSFHNHHIKLQFILSSRRSTRRRAVWWEDIRNGWENILQPSKSHDRW